MIASPVGRMLAKDLRHYWPWIAALWMLNALAASLPFHPINGPQGSIPLQDSVEVLRWCSIVLFALVATQDDSADGDRSGWLCRPISGSQVMAAKLLLVALAILLPVVLATFWQAKLFGATAGQTFGAMLLFVGLATMLGTMAVLVGALTRKLTRAAVTAISVIMVYLFLREHLEQGLRVWLRRPLPYGTWVYTGAAETAAFIFIVVGMLVVSLGVLWVQYRTRRTMAARIAAGALAFAVWVGSMCVGEGLTEAWPAPAAPPHPLATLTAAAPTLSVMSTGVQRFAPGATYEFGLKLNVAYPGPTPPPTLFETQARFTADDGETVVMRTPETIESTVLPLPGSKPANAERLAVFGLAAPPLPPGNQTFTAALLQLPKTEAERLQGKRGRLDAWVQMGDLTMAVRASAPLRVGAEARMGTTIWKVRYVFLLPNGTVEVGFDHTQFVSGVPFRDPSYEYVLYNRRRKEASLRTGNVTTWNVHTFTAVQSGTADVPFRGIWNLKEGTFGGKIDAGWLREAEIAVLEYVGNASERQHVDFGEVQMPASL